MDIEVIRALNRATPFRPYNIRMTSGEIHRVPHPDFIFISPDESYVIVINARGGPHQLDTFLIEETVTVPRPRRRRSKKTAR